jgi:MraZ protein
MTGICPKETRPKACFAITRRKGGFYNVGHLTKQAKESGSTKELFLGKFSRTLDAQNRFTLPAAFQEALTNGATMTQGFDRNLQLLTPGAFDEVYRRASALNLADPLARQLLRLVLGTAAQIDPDAKGGVSIPVDLKEFAGIRDQVVLVGQGDYVEIWSPEAWNGQEEQLRDAEANSSKYAGLSLAKK